jgi:hypothetical protein
MLEALRLDEAAREAEEALKLEPDSLAAKNLRAEALAMMGQSIAEQQTLAEDMTQRQALRIEQMRAEAQDSLRKAKLLIARSDYSGAIAELEIANNLVKYAPFTIDWQGLDVEALTLLESARASASERRDGRRGGPPARRPTRSSSRRSRKRATEGRARGGARSTARSPPSAPATTRTPSRSRSRSSSAIRTTPRPRRVRDAAFRAGRTKVREDYVERKIEQFRRWQETFKEMQIPYIDVITEPDRSSGTRSRHCARSAAGSTSRRRCPSRRRSCASSSARPRCRCPR